MLTISVAPASASSDAGGPGSQMSSQIVSPTRHAVELDDRGRRRRPGSSAARRRRRSSAGAPCGRSPAPRRRRARRARCRRPRRARGSRRARRCPSRAARERGRARPRASAQEVLLEQQVLGRVAGERQLGEQHELGARLARARSMRRADLRLVARDVADDGVDLGEREAQRRPCAGSSAISRGAATRASLRELAQRRVARRGRRGSRRRQASAMTPWCPAAARGSRPGRAGERRVERARAVLRAAAAPAGGPRRCRTAARRCPARARAASWSSLSGDRVAADRRGHVRAAGRRAECTSPGRAGGRAPSPWSGKACPGRPPLLAASSPARVAAETAGARSRDDDDHGATTPATPGRRRRADHACRGCRRGYGRAARAGLSPRGAVRRPGGRQPGGGGQLVDRRPAGAAASCVEVGHRVVVAQQPEVQLPVVAHDRDAQRRRWRERHLRVDRLQPAAEHVQRELRARGRWSRRG